jgi:hypothetical protein
VRAVRPGDLYFLLVPPPAGLGTFLAQRHWLAVIFVAAALTMLGLVVRFANVLLREFGEKGYWGWREEREKFLNSQVVHDESRRLRRLEGERRRREFKHERSSWWDQLRLFR